MVVFVIGPSCAGKSTFIKNNFSDFYKVDLFDYQQNSCLTVDDIWKSYEECKDALIEAIKNHENVVFEHTLLKAVRREYYIKAIEEIKDIDMVVYVINPSTEQILKNAKKRSVWMTENEINRVKEILEIPTINEGFKEVQILTNIY